MLSVVSSKTGISGAMLLLFFYIVASLPHMSGISALGQRFERHLWQINALKKSILRLLPVAFRLVLVFHFIAY